MDLLDKYVIDGNLESIKAVINANGSKLDSEWDDYNLLKKALTYKHKDITKFFIANNFRVNIFSIRDEDTTPLHIAVELEWEDIVLLLLKKGASVEVRDNTRKLTPIQLSFFMRKYQLTDLMLPFDKGQSILVWNTDANNFHIACARNCISAVKNYLRLAKSIDTFSGLTFSNYSGYTPLHFAVHFQSKETVELLLKCGASITDQDKNQNTPLHLASNLYDRSLIDLLLLEHRYISYNPTNLEKVSHFHIACTRNNAKVVYGFLQCGVNINAKIEGGPWDRYTALHLAVIHQCVDIVKLLLSQDNLVKDNSENFLFHVYKTENYEIINLITSRNKSLLATDFGGKIKLNPFFRACIKGDKDEIKSLLSSGALVNEHLPLDSLLFPGATPLHILVVHDIKFIYEIIYLILHKDANVTAKDARGLTPIHVVFQKNCNMIKLLMTVPSRFKSNVSDKEGLSLFHIACAAGIEDVVNWFVDEVGVDVNAAVSEDAPQYPGYTPLHMAASSTIRRKVCLKLLSHGANIMIQNRQGLAPLNLLIQNWSFNHIETDVIRMIMLHLIEVYRRDYITFDSLEFNLLHAACISHNSNEDVVEHYVKHQIMLDSAMNSALNSTCGLFAGFTPLHFAVMDSKKKIIKILLDHGSDPAARSVEGDTPLHISITHLRNLIYIWTYFNKSLCMSDLEDRLFLLEDNPFGSRGFSHFHIACQFGKLEVVKAFLNRGIDPNIRTRRPHSLEDYGETWIGETGLHAAMRTGHREVVLLLLEHGADANALDMFQRTPLHKVIRDDDESMVRLLVEIGGADVNARDLNGETPLHAACRHDVSRAVVYALLEAGADIDLMDKRGQFAINITADVYGSDEDFYALLIPMIVHAVRLKVAGCPMSEKNEELLTLNRNRVIDHVDENFETRCLEELERMECVRLGRRTTLRDLLCIRNVDQLRRLAGNNVFQCLVEDELFEDEKKIALDDFPIYGYLARLQFRRGWKRRKITPVATLALRNLFEKYCIRFPDDCAEIILSYLTDYDLERLNQTAK